MVMTEIKALSIELETFNSKREELIQKALGKFVLIKNGEIVGVFDTPGDALREGYVKFGNNPFLVKQILPSEPPLNFTSNLIAE